MINLCSYKTNLPAVNQPQERYIVTFPHSVTISLYISLTTTTAFYRQRGSRLMRLSLLAQVPEIDELERSMHALLKNRASSLVQRRQLDVNDQAEDFLNAQAGE